MNAIYRSFVLQKFSKAFLRENISLHYSRYFNPHQKPKTIWINLHEKRKQKTKKFSNKKIILKQTQAHGAK